MCRVCNFNVNNCGCNSCGGWFSNLFSTGCTRCATTWNTSRCGCSNAWNTNGCNRCSSTWNTSRCGGCSNARNTNCCNCVTICGNLNGLFSSGGNTANANGYYSRLYGLNTQSGSGCGCGSGYNYEQTD